MREFAARDAEFAHHPDNDLRAIPAGDSTLKVSADWLFLNCSERSLVKMLLQNHKICA